MIKIQDEHHIYTVEFLVGHPYRYYKGLGKAWPKETQCVIKRNGLQIGFGSVVRHAHDEDNPLYAKRASAKKALKQALPNRIWKSLRVKIYEQIK